MECKELADVVTHLKRVIMDYGKGMKDPSAKKTGTVS
jgi:hypothetical protein